MRLTEYIAKLQRIKDDYGDLELIYAKDDEGNGYNKVSYLPEMYYYREEDGDMLNEAYVNTRASKYVQVCCVN